MHDDALDSMIYAWAVIKKKEENKMEGIYVGKVKRSVIGKDGVNLFFVDHRQDITHLGNLIEYDDTVYCLVPTDDIVINNDEILKLRDEVKRLTDDCGDWQARYSKVNNELFQKGLAYGTLETAYKNEKIAGEMLLKDRDCWKAKVEKLEAELTEIKTARTLREAYITGVEKGCESLREERDRWKRRFTSVVNDLSKSLGANGIEFKLKGIDCDAEWVFIIDIPELNEAKKKVEDLETKLAASKSNEAYWRDRKEEEEDHHYYWYHTFDRAVKQAADKGIHIGITGTDEDCNAGVVTVDNMKAAELKSQVVQMEDANQKLRKRISAADEELEAATKRGDYWKSKYDDLAEYWDNTYKDMVACGAKVGVKIGFKGDKSDGNAGKIHITNEKALGLAYVLHNVRQKQDKKWQAMTESLKAKGVEVIYMGEEDEKPIVDIKISEIDILKKELEDLKSRTLDKVEIRLSCGDIVWTYCDGFSHISSNIDIDPANCLRKNYVTVDAESISHGTVPKCSSCAHYVSGSRLADVWCHKPVSKEGPGTIRRLSTEEAEGPACSDFKARKE